MPRPKKNPAYDADKIIKKLMVAVAESYEATGELKITAKEFSMSALKIRKLLITAGAYSNEISDEINMLYSQGKTMEQIQKITGLKKSSINGYLPYTKMVYKPEELSLNAERLNVFRSRQKTVRALMTEKNEQSLWNAVVAFQKYPFHTTSGLPFAYTLKKGRNGDYNRELLVNRGSRNKVLAWSSVMLAFDKALKLRGAAVERTEMLGDIRGTAYIYPILYRFGIIEVPETVVDKMKVKKATDSVAG